jgi:hypothetical protein
MDLGILVSEMMEDHEKRRDLADTRQGTKTIRFISMGARRIRFGIQTEMESMVRCEIHVPIHCLGNL